MAKSKRILFSFDSRNYRNLRDLVAIGRFSTTSDAVRDAVQVARALHDQAQEGYTEIVVRNPKTQQERVVIVPSLQGPVDDTGG